MQGGTIQMYVDYRQLNADENYWKTEKEITRFAYQHIKELKRLKPFDFFKLAPQTYDVRGNEQQEGGKKGEPKVGAPFTAAKALAAADAAENAGLPVAPTGDGTQMNGMQMALNAINAELGSGSVNVNRGPETDISQ